MSFHNRNPVRATHSAAPASGWFGSQGETPLTEAKPLSNSVPSTKEKLPGSVGSDPEGRFKPVQNIAESLTESANWLTKVKVASLGVLTISPPTP